jgi:hypothetical protein
VRLFGLHSLAAPKGYLRMLAILLRQLNLYKIQMEWLSILAFFFVFIHLFAFVLYNKYRILQIIKHLSICRGKELSERDYQDLMESYTSFLGYAQGFPSKKHYNSLYTNPAFLTFYTKSSWLMKYLLSALAVGLVANGALDYFVP